MRAGFMIISVGAVVTVFGVLFFMQGNSIVGPTTSFMYSNPQWIVNGKWISISGIIILVVGIGISLRRLRS